VHFQTIEKTVAGDGRRAWSLDSLKASLKHFKKRTPGSKNALKPFGFAGQPVISRSDRANSESASVFSVRAGRFAVFTRFRNGEANN
jgi:hypothetical protein